MDDATQRLAGLADGVRFPMVTGSPDAALWYAPSAPAMTCMLQAAMTALDMQRRVGDAGRETIRRQQDMTFGMPLRILAPDVAPRSLPDGSFADLSRLRFGSFERSMAAAMRAFDPGAQAGAARAARGEPGSAGQAR